MSWQRKHKNTSLYKARERERDREFVFFAPPTFWLLKDRNESVSTKNVSTWYSAIGRASYWDRRGEGGRPHGASETKRKVASS